MALNAPARSPAVSQPVLWMLVGVCAVLPLGELIKMALRPEVLFPDFFGLWSFGRFVLSHAPASVYSDPAMAAYQQSLGLPHGDAFYPFPYPPWILILLAPVGALPYSVAHVVWLATTFAAYSTALAPWRWKPSLQGLLLLAPTSAICFLVGQNGFLTGALMIGGVSTLRTRPLQAGVLLASLAYKPQLAILAPFLLLFGRHWRALAAAVVWTLVLSGLATLAFGADIWISWLANMRDHAAALSGGRPALLDMMPTITSAVLLLGGGYSVAHIAQLAGAAFGLAALWRLRNHDDEAARSVFPLAAILSAPYAFDYDLPATTGVLLALLATQARPGAVERPSFVLLIAGILTPGILFARVGVFAVVVPVVFAALVIALCGWTRDSLLGGGGPVRRLRLEPTTPFAALAGRILQRGRIDATP